MNKSVLFVVVLATALTAGLYTLPKVVVRNESKQLGESLPVNRTKQTPTSTQHGAAAGNEALEGAAAHEKPLSPEQQKQLTALRTQFLTASSAQKESAATKLIALFRDVTKYDSAAHYADLLATSQPTEQNMLQAGDQYFEAYTFAVDENKTAMLGQKTRDFYQKVLAKNPNLLAAKANMAMTYVNTDTPMQGIMLLRDVLKQDPTNELALFNLGLLSMRSGQYERAVERFRQILITNPASRKAQFYLGVSLAESGQKAEAKKVLAQVKTQEKDPQILAAVQEYEERLK
ncbi:MULTISPECIES: tetratricopeptide repeat protein [Spirosoma]|uniref:Tetratricopeptide repeat protein n=1 Tax=Spirosoma liriopis TaxID=2937440 RepID=A0ABT0HJX5_9BACT|nr:MULTISPECIES: tetratricopeptide repeat protein [Spirosoma]MCK8492469.1 tetratricopeptide repeat protein [Spirosoma liriopis]UHG91940.1 tetratricopeptide repeat protein [Spirosoma oryzicola]